MLLGAGGVFADGLPLVDDVEAQPLKAQAARVAQALEFLGEPLNTEESKAFDAALSNADDGEAVKAIQQLLDQRAIAGVNINPESRVKVAAGAARPRLVQNGWSVFLVKVHNQAGVTARLKADSPNAEPIYKQSTGSPRGKKAISAADVKNRWLDLRTFDSQPLAPKLSGLPVEYRIVQIYSRDAGQREATLSFNVGQGTQDIGFRNEIAVLFNADPAVQVTLEVIDHDGEPTTGQFVFRDANGRVYPARSRRLAPDFFFHDQIYRNYGDQVYLAPGKYRVEYSRGPEYRNLTREIDVPDSESHTERFRLQRWIQMTDHRWYSGDHHVHAAGCAHYESPTEGVDPGAMMRHILGEDLNVGCVLTWGPCWYHQKSFFEGKTSDLSRGNYLMRYDVEVSGFPSSAHGHLCLLNLREDDYTYPEHVEFDYSYGSEEGRFSGTKTDLIGQWPSWDLPVLKWGMEQGGVVGFSHSGWGLELPTDDLPNYNMPPFDGIGANEYIVDVCHGVCDFISAVDTPAVWELTIWYHTLNCGYTCRISGETDFPCIYGDRVGLGRIYVKLDDDQELNYDNWVQGVKLGRSYCGDGLSHLFDFSVNGLEVGSTGAHGEPSFISAKSGEALTIKVNAAALLDETPNDEVRNRSLSKKPYWHVERARVDDSRQVPVELIVNGLPVAKKLIDADGHIEQLEFNYTPERSSWIALRVFPSCHTNPIFVEVGGKPIRASRRSADWCLEAVDVCWNSKKELIRDHEIDAARAAYDFAREQYRQRAAESFDDRQ